VLRFNPKHGNRLAHPYSTADRSIVCCSIFPANFSHFATALIFLWLLSLHQGKESNNLNFIKKKNIKIFAGAKKYMDWQLGFARNKNDNEAFE
jgi:hypothetical protein